MANSPDESPNQSNSDGDENRDYRNEYIRKIDANDDRNNQLSFLNDQRFFPQESCFACVSISDFELQPINATTTTSFFSPSMNTLPTDGAQYVRESSIRKTNTLKLPTGSVLVQAYSQQEKEKSANSQ